MTMVGRGRGTGIVAAIGMAVLASSAAAAQTPPAPVTAAPADPAREAAATRAVAALVPPGTYQRMMRDQMPKLMDAMMKQMMGSTPAELGLPARPGGRPGQTLGGAASGEDPFFEERMRISTRVMFEEMGTLFDKLEPRIRAGLARAFTRKFTLAQLNDMNAFFATPSGAVFAREYLLTFADPELMQEMVSAMPELMKAMPAIMAKAEAATKHLPPPPVRSVPE